MCWRKFLGTPSYGERVITPEKLKVKKKTKIAHQIANFQLPPSNPMHNEEVGSNPDQTTQTTESIMTFSHKNPVTNKIWNREELFEALQLEQAKNKKSNPDIITWEAQKTNLVKRWEIHTVEFNAAVKDLYQAGRMTREMFNRVFA